MPAYFEQGFMVREPAWHGLGEVLADYPERDEAMRLAGHDFHLVEVGMNLDPSTISPEAAEGIDPQRLNGKVKDWKALVNDKTGDIVHCAKDSYTVIQNETAWDLVDAIVNRPNVQYETGLTLEGGRLCSVLAWLNEPVQIKGDDSLTFPFINVSWRHDGFGALKARSTNVRVVCANTEAAAEAQGSRYGTDFTFHHSGNVMDRIEQAREAISGARIAQQEYVEIMNEMAEIAVTEEQREWFIEALVPMPNTAIITPRVMGNVDGARAEVRALFSGPTIPEAHKLTAYGLNLAGVEYLDHLRGYRNRETLLGRSIMSHQTGKAKLQTIIKEVVAA